MEAELKNDAPGGTANMWPIQEQKERQTTRQTGQTITTIETWQPPLLKDNDHKFTIYKGKYLISCWRHLTPVNDRL